MAASRRKSCVLLLQNDLYLVTDGYTAGYSWLQQQLVYLRLEKTMLGRAARLASWCSMYSLSWSTWM